MIKGNANAITCLLVFAVVIASLLFVNTSTVNNVAHAAKSQTKFNKDDFMIKDFGIGNDGNPFLTVEGKAGGTIPDKEDTGYVYVFAKIIQLIYDYPLQGASYI
ncbi:MAG: hypothetical protein WBY28_05095 [Nitrososphaeraceae archaeon]